MSTFKFLLVFILSGSAGAVFASADEPDFQVEVDPAVYPKAAFEKKGVKATNKPARVKRADALPDKAEREAALGKVPGLSSDVANMDELDRDLLFVRARTKPLKELQKTYPDIEAKKLARLREILTTSEPKTGAK